jgi:hypothetical protein
MIHLFWKPPTSAPPVPSGLAAKHRIRAAFDPIEDGDSIAPSLQPYLRAQACSADETRKLVQELMEHCLAAPGTIELQGDECGKDLGEKAAFQAPASLTTSLVRDRFAEQTYLQDRRCGGVDALAAWRLAGGRGDGVRIVDIEPGGLPSHPDLPRVKRLTSPPQVAVPESRAAHTAEVLGVICASNDRRGVVGLASDADVMLAQATLEDDVLHPLNVLRFAVSQVVPPAVVVVPMTVALPRVDRPSMAGDVLLEQVPLEAWSIGRAVLEIARRRGIYVVMAAGNEGHCLDSRMNLAPAAEPRGQSDAIVVGAALPDSDEPLAVSGNGIRVDVSCWGGGVTTSTIDSITGAAGHRRDFGGTSAATAIVAGCVACIAGILHANGYPQASPAEIRRLLVRTGHWSSRGLGPRPDVGAALEELAREGARFQSISS